MKMKAWVHLEFCTIWAVPFLTRGHNGRVFRNIYVHRDAAGGIKRRFFFAVIVVSQGLS